MEKKYKAAIQEFHRFRLFVQHSLVWKLPVKDDKNISVIRYLFRICIFITTFCGEWSFLRFNLKISVKILLSTKLLKFNFSVPQNAATVNAFSLLSLKETFAQV